MTPFVSVIVPCYNQGSYLPFALRSIQAQTFADWEIVLVDDGSTDDTAAVGTQFSDPRVHYLFQENQGLSAARNTGIRAAQGQYLTFLDSDDEWEPQFLERCIEAVTSDRSIVGVYTRSYFIDQNGCALPNIGGEVVVPAAFRSRLLEGGHFPVNAALVRADVVHQVGMFDTQLTSEEDWDLWLRISERHVMQAIAEPLARYRIYLGSMSTNIARMHNNRISVLVKYFDWPAGDASTWSEEKRRAYAFAFRSTCIGYLQQAQVDEAWQYLKQAVVFWPSLLKRLDTLYELACGDKPWGLRSPVDPAEIQMNGSEIVDRLNRMFADADPQLQAVRSIALGNICFVLGMMSDQVGDWRSARRYLIKALEANPRLGISLSFMRRLVKVWIGPRLIGALRRARRINTSSSQYMVSGFQKGSQHDR